MPILHQTSRLPQVPSQQNSEGCVLLTYLGGYCACVEAAEKDAMSLRAACVGEADAWGDQSPPAF